ncbi:MAG: M20/M25/M40 family metallo-hydrolase [Halioglobus sp.]
MSKLAAILILALGTGNAMATEQVAVLSDHARKTLDIYTHIVEMDTSKTKGNTEAAARFLGDELIAAGFAESDVEVLTLGNAGALVARYPGDGSSDKKPILLLGHLDVVEANASDWERPPFKLTTDEIYFFARGTKDNKFGIAQLTSTFIRLKKEGFTPNRDLYLVFSGDEESTMNTTRMLAFERPDLALAEFALNSDAGGGKLEADGSPVKYSIQTAEKTYATWEMTTRNPGGHSSRPSPDNAIYDLAAAIGKIQAYRFPVRWNEMTLASFQETGNKIGGELGDAMLRFAYAPTDTTASDRLAIESSYVGSTRTTCVVTMLQAGHAENALPQSATATINCRIFPGIPVADIEAVLRKVVDDDSIEFAVLDEPVSAPASELRADVKAAVSKAVHQRYPGLKVSPSMSSGATDAMHFRRAGVPTMGISGVFMNPDDNFSHGLNERVPQKAFHDALDHWSIILRELAGQTEQ